MDEFVRIGAIVTNIYIVYTPKEKRCFYWEAYVDIDVISIHPPLLELCAQEMAYKLLEGDGFVFV